MQTLIVYVTAEVFVFIWSQYHISPYGNFGKEKKKKNVSCQLILKMQKQTEHDGYIQRHKTWRHR